MAKKRETPRTDRTDAWRRNALQYLTAEERKKYEIASEIGLLARVKEVGWAGLSAKETGRIGGLIGQGNRRREADVNPHSNP